MDCDEGSDEKVYFVLKTEIKNEADVAANASSEYYTCGNLPLGQCVRPTSMDTDSSNAVSCKPDGDTPASPKTGTTQHETRRSSSKDTDLHQAVANSATLTGEPANEAALHQRRLDNLLSAHGLKRTEIAADGDCFFQSSSLLLNVPATEIRQGLCDYLEEEFQSFFDFFSFPGDENERYMEYVNNVSELRHSGRWSNKAGDMLPLALASWTKRAVRLYTSNPNRPIVDVYPVGGVETIDHNDGSKIALGLLHYPDAPHYNACTPKETKDDVQSTRVSSVPSLPLNHAMSETHTSEETKDDVQGTCVSSVSSLPLDHGMSETHTSEEKKDDVQSIRVSSVSSLPLDHAMSETQSPNTQPENMAHILSHSQQSPSDHETYSSKPMNESISPVSFLGESPAFDTPNDEHVSANQQSHEECSSSICTSPETPRKSGTFKKPPKTRKRIAKPETWKKNVRKALRLQGKAYISGRGAHVPAQQVLEVDCSNCKLKCFRLNEKREQIFQEFYALDSYEKQKSFVCAHVTAKKTRTIYNVELSEAEPKTRHVTRQCYFTVDGQRERVCKRFFACTLGICPNSVDHALQHSEQGVFVGQDGRGRSRPHNKTPDRAVERVKTHIRSFPTVLSHHTRRDTRREYLSTDLNVSKMHKLYAEECKKEGLNPVSSSKYRNVFNESFNLSFHKPKKDQCSACASYENNKTEGTLTEAEEKAHRQHQNRKESVRKQMQADKQAACKTTSKHVVTVHPEAALQAPCGSVSQLHYKRKLSVYTFTVYSLGDGKGTCFTWNETEGMRGSCEIATCLFLYLQSLPTTVREVIIYSDPLGGQKRNQNITAALVHAVKSIPSLETIQIKYFETGHTHMECESVHDTISLAKKCTPVHVPSDWDIVLRMARRNKKYTVIPLKHTSFYDFKKLSASFLRKTKTDTKGREVNWPQIRCVTLYKGQEDLMYFKRDFAEEDHRTLRLTGSPSSLKTLPLRYTSKLPISAAKHRDLMSLCESGMIPSHYNDFFQALPVSTCVKDRLAEPDVHDSDTGSDTD